MSLHNQFLRYSAVVLACAGLLLLPALINGYPLVYSDTGTYLRSAFEGYVPEDRPYWYGVFIRLASFGGNTLWGVAAVQALLCAGYIVRAFKLAIAPTKALRGAVVACAFLAFGTGLGWYAGQVIPDIFTGIGLLAMYLLLQDGSGRWRLLDSIVVAMACWMHLSNLLILPLAGAALLVIGKRTMSVGFPRRMGWFGLTLLLAWGGLAMANRTLGGTAYISRSGHAFLMGRMIDLGMLRPYLEEHCPTEHFGLCAYKDNLPADGQEFIWGGSSPMAKEGGWAATRAEYGRIVYGSLLEPRFLWWHVRGSLKSTVQLLAEWEIGEGIQSSWYRTAESPPYRMMEAHFPHEMGMYRASLQNGGRGELDMRWPDRLYRLVLGASLLVLLVGLVRFRRNREAAAVRTLLPYAVVSVVIGTWVCATLSTPIPRYLGRDSWLVPLAACVAVAVLWKGRRGVAGTGR